MGAVKNLNHDEICGQVEYRGFHLVNEFPPIPIRDFDWIATDPNGEGDLIANGSTLEECKADVDRYIEEQADEQA